MTHFLVDYENVGVEGVKKTGAKQSDKVTLFYSEQCKNVALEAIEELSKKGVTFDCIKATVGSKNALDFQLISFLGFLIGVGGKNVSYVIVSNDKGYENTITFWKGRGILIKLQPVGSNKTAKKTNKITTQTKANQGKITIAEVKEALGATGDLDDMLKIVNIHKSKESIKHCIDLYYRNSNKATAVYKKLRPLLKKKGKT